MPYDSSTIQQASNYYQNLFQTKNDPSVLAMQLPTTLHLTYDRFFNKWLAVQAQVDVPLVFSNISSHSGNYNPVSVSITSRAETPWGGIYIPLSYNSISGLQAGAALRLGPVVIGSGSLINTRLLNKTKSVDLYCIVRIPLFGYKAYREKGLFDKHPALNKKERKALDCPR